MRTPSALLALLALSACPVVEETPEPDPEPAVQMRNTMDGEVTWAVDFDAEAEAAGATDCSYTRHYSGSEDWSAPWICGDCDELFRADVELVAGREDCFVQVSDRDPAAVEWIGLADETYLRSGGGSLILQGSAVRDGDVVALEHSIADVAATLGGTLTFNITGSLTLADEEGDPTHGIAPPDEAYACGWPGPDAPPYDGDYVLALDQPLPDGLLMDHCDEYVRLHDFLGEYLIIDISAMDCPPCRSMAAQEGAFVEAMAAEGLPVEVVTLLAPSLSNTGGTPTHEQLMSWINDYDLHSPVLADRGWGIGVVRPAIPDDYAYPTSVVVRPDGTVVDIRTGFGGWDAFAEFIRADAQ